jgi:hypothetical protein
MAKKMKNRMKLWRSISKKEYDGTTEIRYGRRLRDALCDMLKQEIFTPNYNQFAFKSKAKFDTYNNDIRVSLMVRRR